MNSVALVGRITREVEIRYSQGQNPVAVCSFTLAINKPFRNAQGQYEADFIPCVAIGSSAEFMGRYVRKGDMLSVEGRIQTRQYQTQQGENRTMTEVVVEKVNNLSPKPVEAPNVNPQNQQYNVPPQQPQYNNYQQNNQPKPQPQQPNSFGLDNDDDTLPWL